MARLNKWEKAHLRNIATYERQIDQVFQSAAREAAMLASAAGKIKPDKPFSFTDYPATRKRLEKLLSGLKSGITAVIINGINTEWQLSNRKNDELVKTSIGRYWTGKRGAIHKIRNSKRYFNKNDDARQSFQNRCISGLNLSDRVWRYTEQFKSEIEMGIDIGLRDGLSAEELSRDLRQYLRYPDKLFRRVRDEHGVLHLSKAAKAFHPGHGVYRSSYKNARRLAATETNMAYRTADYVRWQQLDFVVGIEIRLSNNHTLNGVPFEDICDFLQGRYPKDFKFTGWHPHCRCHTVTILKTEEEMAEDNRRIMNGDGTTNDSVNSVRELPKAFTDWAEQNEERAKQGRSLPYFIRDNKGMLDGFYLDEAINETRAKAQFSGNEVQSLAEGIARRYGAVCTPINFKGAESIRRKVYSERGENPTFTPDALKDTVRTTIVASLSEIQEIISQLKDSGGFLRQKPQRTPLGYTGHIVNIRTKNGMVGEIQVNTARMIYAKEKPADARRVIGDDLWNQIHKETGLEGGLGPQFYEAYRVLDPNSSEAKRIIEQSREYYRHFNS